MGFIRLTTINNICLELKEYQLVVLKEECNKNSENSKEKKAQIFKDFEDLWVPYDESQKIEILINTDCIERCEEQCAASVLIEEADWCYLPRVSKVFLKDGKEYLVFESVKKIQSLIEDVAQK